MKPLIVTPCYGGSLCLNYVTSIIRLKTAAIQMGMDLEFYFRSGESLITRARNDCVAYFMENPLFTHLFWIDADIGFESRAAFRLLNSGYDVAAGVYPMKGDGAGFTVDPTGMVVNDAGFAVVQEAPTGFMCIKRDVFDRLAVSNPELRYVTRDGSPRYRFFDTMIDPQSNEYLSEDYAFCRRWESAGGLVHVDAQSNLTHQGSKLYAGQFMRKSHDNF